jgi:type VI secretion system protein ImpC
MQTDVSINIQKENILESMDIKKFLSTSNHLYTDISFLTEQIDRHLSQSLDAIFHQTEFQSLESAWIGVNELLNSSESQADIQCRLFQAAKVDLLTQATQSQNYKDSHLFQLIYNQEFNMPGGEPLSCLIGNYVFNHLENDTQILSYIANIAHDSFCPFLAAASAQIFYHNKWDSTKKLKNLHYILDDQQHIAWGSLRESEQAKFISLVAPRYLGRYPYRPTTDQFNYSYAETTHTDTDYCWVNSAFAQARCLIESYKKSGWCTSIRGYENGGRLENLPMTHNLNATECHLSDTQERALSEAGITSICQYKNNNYAVIFSSETLHKPAVYDDITATQNAMISARLPYVMATSRFAHYLKIIARDKIGSFMNAEEIESWLNQWISQYVNANPKSKQILKSRFPLAEAAIKVKPHPENPGAFHATIHLKPWLQLEALTVSMRLVTELPNSHN